ncbi:MAG TPA: DUF983 domain-containing protein [Ohtaekwangia sp.]|nr:DUF983 domain-containing protein [Ohtaekwangia sp.]
MQTTSYLGALLQGKCPRCRQGDVFTFPVAKVTKFNVMNEKCPVCGIRLEPEPGFYQGAMFVSYAIAVAFIVAVGVILYVLFNDPNEWIYISVCIAVILLVVPLNYRYSRILYLYWFGGDRYKHTGV